MIDDRIALSISTRNYTEVISSPNLGALFIAVVAGNQLVSIKFPKDPFKNGVHTSVLVGNPITLNTILNGELYGKYSIAEVDKSMADCSFTCFSDKETPDASMLALEEVLPWSNHVDNSFVSDYTRIFFEFVELRRSRIAEYTRGSFCVDNELLCRAVYLVQHRLTASRAANINNVRELVYACKIYDTHFCRSIKWLLTKVECYPCDAVGTSKLSDADSWFKQFVADPILEQYANKRVRVYELIAGYRDNSAKLPPVEYTYSEEIFTHKLRICGVDIRYIR